MGAKNPHTMNELMGEVLAFEGGNSDLTEEFIYNNPPSDESGKIPILSSATQESKYMGDVSRHALISNSLRIFEGPCIVVARNGYAGTMKYVDRGEFTINDHAYVLMPQPKWKTKINLRWLSQQYQGLFFSLITSKSDNATFAKEYAQKQRIKIPDITFQNMIAERLFKLDRILNEVNRLQKLSVMATINTKVIHSGCMHQIGEVLQFKGGNSGLTAEFVYYNIPKNAKDRLPILTGAILEENFLGYVSKEAKIDSKPLKIFHPPCIVVSRKGRAGVMTFIENQEFTINDDAYVLIAREEWKQKINLQWFVYQYQSFFYNLITSKSDNATFNKKYAEKQTIVIPEIGFQNSVADEISRLGRFNGAVKRLELEIQDVLSKEIRQKISKANPARRTN